MKSEVEILRIGIHKNGECLKFFEFKQFPIQFGRAQECDLMLNFSQLISRQHGSIDVKNGVIEVNAFNSKNGISSLGKRYSILQFQGEGQFNIGDISFRLCAFRREVVPLEVGVEPPLKLTQFSSESSSLCNTLTAPEDSD